MNILHINDSLARGGAETSILEIFAYMKKVEVRISILVLAAPVCLSYDDPITPKDILNLEAHPRKNLLTCVRRLRRQVKKLHPEIVNVHSFFGLLSLKLAFPVKRDFKSVATLRNLGFDAWPATSLYQKFRKRVHGYLLGKVDFITAVSEAVSNHYNIHLGVTTDQIIPDSLPALALAVAGDSFSKKPTSNDQMRLAIPGRVTREKGHWVALDAFKSLVGYRDIKLDVLGGGRLQLELEEQCKKLNLNGVVSISGVLSHKDLLSRLKNSDICLIPSLFEGFGIVALEAMALGVPVIASDIGGLSEIISDEVTGLLVPPGDSHALASACRRLVENPDLKASIAHNAREMVLKKYSMDSIGPQWLDMYQKLVNK